ncbi:MAG: TVP38/TMEM64 family protein [Spirochaetes bacterium]|nr:MAG: TVP38/TMEM64 family protein [Spirochaetota bacterium]
MMKKKPLLETVSYITFPLFIATIIVIILIFHEQLWDLFSTPEKLKDWVRGWGLFAPLIFVGLQFFQVVIFIVPGEVPQIAAGYLFGVCIGVLLSITGIIAGSTFNFFLARKFGTAFVKKIAGAENIDKLKGALGSDRMVVAFFLLFLIPGIPKDVLCYVAGISPLKFPLFLLVSGLGRLPGILGSVMMGDAAAEKRWFLAFSIMSVAALLFFLGIIFREKILKKVKSKGVRT